LKLAPLLAQYLYEHKKLELAGIGTFILDPSARINTDAQHVSEGISFKHDHSIKEDENLVKFISAETGKMKSLASGDLNSYIELALQFLNIGKPFQIEGIGTLVKAQDTHLDFTADPSSFYNVKETGIKELSATSISDGSLTTYETLRPHSEKSPILKRIFLTLLTIGTVVIIILVGYKTYKSNSSKNTSEETEITSEAVPVSDTTKFVSAATDTIRSVKQTEQKISNGNYRFVVEVANKKRAYYRYNMLKKGGVHIQISTSDSINYKLFFVLPANPTDTARIADSLTIWYPAVNKKKTFTEK